MESRSNNVKSQIEFKEARIVCIVPQTHNLTLICISWFKDSQLSWPPTTVTEIVVSTSVLCCNVTVFPLALFTFSLVNKIKLTVVYSVMNLKFSYHPTEGIKNQATDFLYFLAHLVMSLCNHALPIVCRCCRCRHRHLCTAVPVTALIIETSYLADICTWNIKSMWCVFLVFRIYTKDLYLVITQNLIKFCWKALCFSGLFTEKHCTFQRISLKSTVLFMELRFSLKSTALFMELRFSLKSIALFMKNTVLFMKLHFSLKSIVLFMKSSVLFTEKQQIQLIQHRSLIMTWCFIEYRGLFTEKLHFSWKAQQKTICKEM